MVTVKMSANQGQSKTKRPLAAMRPHAAAVKTDLGCGNVREREEDGYSYDTALKDIRAGWTGLV